VIRGSNTGVPVSDTTAPAQPLSLTYNEPIHGNFFFGTANAVPPDADGYVITELQPTGGAWLPGIRTSAPLRSDSTEPRGRRTDMA